MGVSTEFLVSRSNGCPHYGDVRMWRTGTADRQAIQVEMQAGLEAFKTAWWQSHCRGAPTAPLSLRQTITSCVGGPHLGRSQPGDWVCWAVTMTAADQLLQLSDPFPASKSSHQCTVNNAQPVMTSFDLLWMGALFTAISPSTVIDSTLFWHQWLHLATHVALLSPPLSAIVTDSMGCHPLKGIHCWACTTGRCSKNTGPLPELRTPSPHMTYLLCLHAGISVHRICEATKGGRKHMPKSDRWRSSFTIRNSSERNEDSASPGCR